jgi:hypothetical protein
MWRKGDIPPRLTFWEACDRAPRIIQDGEYFRCLGRWCELFPAEQLHILVLDDAAADPFAYMRNMYETLGVNPVFRAPKTASRANEHQTPRSAWAARAAFRWSRSMHSRGLHGPVELGKRLGLQRMVLHGGRVVAKDPPPLRDEDWARLRIHYRSDVSALSELIGRDLVSLWLDPPTRVHDDKDDSLKRG